MFQAVCAARCCLGGTYCGTMLQSNRRRDRILWRALPPPSRFDRMNHLRIMQQIHIHLSTASAGRVWSCEGSGGDLFFAMRLYQPLLSSCVRYPACVCWA